MLHPLLLRVPGRAAEVLVQRHAHAATTIGPAQRQRQRRLVDRVLLLVAAGVRVEDRPLYPHRGLMLDTGRTYFPVSDILRTIDAMAANKINVFHWHITDSQSFPIELPSEPQLAEKGAYGEDMRYTVKDVKRIVEFAMSRGVRVVPEIDSPGKGLLRGLFFRRPS